MARYYPRDDDQLSAFWDGRMSLRRLRVLVQHLPPESATARYRAGHVWTADQLLLADIVDVLRFWRCEWLTSQGAHPDEPEPLPRPGIDDPDDRRREIRAAHDVIAAQLHREA